MLAEITRDPDRTLLRFRAAKSFPRLAVMRLISPGVVSVLDASDVGQESEQCVGVCVDAAASGHLADVVTEGRLESPYLSLTINTPVYCGADGVLVQSTSGLGFVRRVGFGLAPNVLWVGVVQGSSSSAGAASSAGSVPYRLRSSLVFEVPDDKQALFSEEITVDDGAEIKIGADAVLKWVE
jgi:hypothetical protein